MRKILSPLSLLILLGFNCFSQSIDTGYVITNVQDTLWGKIREDMFSKKVKIIINGKLQKYEVTELLGYKRGDVINKRFSSDMYMATLEISGKINFYAIRVKGEYGFDQFFLEKDGESCEVTKRTLKTIIPDWLKDYACESELLKKEPNFRNIDEIIKEYNQCNK